MHFAEPVRGIEMSSFKVLYPARGRSALVTDLRCESVGNDLAIGVSDFRASGRHVGDVAHLGAEHATNVAFRIFTGHGRRIQTLSRERGNGTSSHYYLLSELTKKKKFPPHATGIALLYNVLYQPFVNY